MIVSVLEQNILRRLMRGEIDFLDALEMADESHVNHAELTANQKEEKKHSFDASIKALLEKEIFGVSAFIPQTQRRPGCNGISRNIGIPEKFRGWEFQDIQYHGGQFYDGEW